MLRNAFNNMIASKSRVEYYLQLLSCIYHDVVGALVTEGEAARDINCLMLRTKAEGISFLTKTLPRLGKAIDYSLATGSRLDVPNFRKEKGSQLPHFMRTLFKLVFSSDGYPLLEDSTEEIPRSAADAARTEPRLTAVMQSKALRAMRQISFLFYKIELPYTKADEDKVISDFVETDNKLPSLAEFYSDDEGRVVCHDAVLATARRICGVVLGALDPCLGLPKHGPGAVATGESSAEKHSFSRFYRRLDAVYKYDQWFYSSSNHLVDCLADHLALEELEAGTAKVVLVPKDSRGPRLISCEPLEYQWIQQAQMSTLVGHLERHRWTKGHVNFTDQSINQRLALEASRTQEFATLDMKEASDRVSLELVKVLFPQTWFEALYASRTPATKLPDGRVHQMKKFAPMGSAVCFPVESFVFWSLCVAAIHVTHNTSLRKAMKSVYVYGDDIIVRSDYHATVQTTLPRFGLMFNPSKCCTAGSFRESCGVDAYKGYNVTPLRLKKEWSSRRSPDQLASYVAFSNAAYKRGWWRVAQCILERIQRDLKGSVPVVSDEDIGCIAFIRPDWQTGTLSHARRRLNKDLMRMEVLGYRLRPAYEYTKVEGWPLLLRILTDLERRQSEPSLIAETGKYPIAHRNKLSRAWTPYRTLR